MPSGKKRAERVGISGRTPKAGGGRVGTCWSFALALFGAFAYLPAAAQQPATVFPAEYPSRVSATDPAAPSGNIVSAMPASGVVWHSQDLPVALGPAEFEFYTKGGLAFPLGRGPLPEHVRMGWALQFGVRELITCPRPDFALFVNFGGGYVENHGRGNSVVTSGVLHGNEPSENQVHPLNDFFNTSINKLERGNLLVSLDGEYYPARLNQPGVRQVHLDFRGGLRGGVLHADYNQIPTAALNNLIPTITGHRSLGFTNNAAAFDQPFGLFTSVGVGVTYYNVRFGGFSVAELTLQAEAEFARDWINLSDFSGGERSLWTVSPLLTFALSF
jgi:hypothetical protein